MYFRFSTALFVNIVMIVFIYIRTKSADDEMIDDYLTQVIDSFFLPNVVIGLQY